MRILINITVAIFLLSSFLMAAGCAKKSDESANTNFGDGELSENVESSDIDDEEDEEDAWESINKDLYYSYGKYTYQPRLREYKYMFDSTLISRSADLTNGDWKSRGFDRVTYYGEANPVMNKIAAATFDGIDLWDFGTKWGKRSEVYDSLFCTQSDDSEECNRSIRLNIFRHPETGLPMIAVNGRLVNCDRMNINAHENGTTVEMSFQCLKDHPVLDLESEDMDYPSSIDPYIFMYTTKRPFYWYAHELQKNASLRAGNIDIEDGMPRDYTPEKLYFAKKKIDELNDGLHHSEYCNAVRYYESIDPNNNDYNKYFYIDLTIYDCNSNPSVSCTFDGQRFALICSNNRPVPETPSYEDISKIESEVFGNYSHRVVANRQNIDPMNLDVSIAASNLGLYGKTEVARELITIGFDTYINGQLFGRIFEVVKEGGRCYRLNVFKNGNPYQIESIIIPDLDYLDGNIILTTRGRHSHLEKLTDSTQD